MLTSELRFKFLDYFKKNSHEVVDSSPLIPANDETLLFTNAGMVQFKDVFLGSDKRSYKRATTTQRCIRAGGKHNDLENVGYTLRHHTFFEMLGNFSFGDYFKEEAIQLAWNFLTNELGIKKEKLWISVFRDDDEAAEIWSAKIGIDPERIVRMDEEDNFWSMGDTGPCGPCSEIFYDHGDHLKGGLPGSKDEDGDRFIEIWNLVFMQFEQLSDGSRRNLPRPSIDTGMGLERIGAVLQGKHDNYDTDTMRKIIEASAFATNVEPYGENNVHHRVIADHLRSSCFLISEGVLPSNEGRGYVLRRIMRRAMRHIHLLGENKYVMHLLVPALVQEMGQAFPELITTKSMLEETLYIEEKRFKETLERGLFLLGNEIKLIPDGGTLSGDVAFKLYDTYGFPLDLTQDALREKGFTVDSVGFQNAMNRQREKARSAWSGSGDKADDPIWFDLQERITPTEFLGYETTIAQGKPIVILHDGKEVSNIKKGQTGQVIFNQTPFYAEAGGQVSDVGTFHSDNANGLVSHVKNKDKLSIHTVKMLEGVLNTASGVTLEVDKSKRDSICRNHSATHLMHEALRSILGDHVAQRGSLNDFSRIRFDFSHSKALTKEELQNVELKINQLILEDSSVMTEVLPYEEAIKKGALALFGEKYDDEVRVLSMGNDSFSVELCGGTHVKSLNDIGLFKLISQSSVASGIRRIEAKTGDEASSSISIIEKMSFDSQNKEKKSNKNKAEKISKSILNGKILDINDIKFYHDILEDIDGKNLRSLIDECKKDLGSGIICLISRDNKKATIAIGVTNDLLDIFDSVQLVRIASEKMSGKGGGGRPDMALSGGSEPNKAEEAIEVLIKKIKEKN